MTQWVDGYGQAPDGPPGIYLENTQRVKPVMGRQETNTESRNFIHLEIQAVLNFFFIEEDNDNGTDTWDKRATCAVPGKATTVVKMQNTVPAK